MLRRSATQINFIWDNSLLLHGRGTELEAPKIGRAVSLDILIVEPIYTFALSYNNGGQGDRDLLGVLADDNDDMRQIMESCGSREH